MKSSTEKIRNRSLDSFGGFIRQARERCGLSLSEAAQVLHCTKGYLHKLETVPAVNPTIDTLANMAAAYDVELAAVARLAAEGAPDAEYRKALTELQAAKARVAEVEGGKKGKR
jgi:transcriptional regulator with XRE-family HTH domain